MVGRLLVGAPVAPAGNGCKDGADFMCRMFWVMAVCIVASVFDFLGLVYGSGVHQADLPPETVTTFIKVSMTTTTWCSNLR
jgi:hypothetical protein